MSSLQIPHIAVHGKSSGGQNHAFREVAEVTRQMNAMKRRAWSEPVTHSYFQTYLIGRSTIMTEALVHLTMGGPLFVYNGGLLNVAVRHYDADRRRPGMAVRPARPCRTM